MVQHGLTDIQRRLIASVQLDSKQPLAVLAKRLGIRERSVRYHLSTLLERGVLRETPFLNVYPLGYRYVNLYFSLGSSKSSAVEKMVEFLAEAPQVSWLAELGGDFHFGMSLMVEHVEEVKDFLDKVAQRYPDMFFEKDYVFHLNLTVFPPKYLGPRGSTTLSLGYGPTPPCRIDALDQRILAVMSKRALCTGRAVARALGRPHATVELRLRRLEREKVVIGYWYQFDASSLGYQTLKLLIYAKGHRFDLSRRLFEFCRQHPQISYFIECLGSWDFELGLDVEEASKVAPVTRAILDAFGPSINTIKVVPMFRVLKWQQFARS